MMSYSSYTRFQSLNVQVKQEPASSIEHALFFNLKECHDYSPPGRLQRINATQEFRFGPRCEPGQVALPSKRAFVQTLRTTPQ